MRNKTVCNRCFKKEIKRSKKLAKREALNPSLEYDKEYLYDYRSIGTHSILERRMIKIIIIMIPISVFMIILTIALL